MEQSSFDPRSESFNALLALQHPEKVVLPFPNVRPLDTVLQCSRLIPPSLRFAAGLPEKAVEVDVQRFGRSAAEASTYFKRRAYQQQVWLQRVMQDMILAPDQRRSQGRVQVEWVQMYCRSAAMSRDQGLRACAALCEKQTLVRVVLQSNDVDEQIWYQGKLVAVDRSWNVVLEQVQEWTVNGRGEQHLVRDAIGRVLIMGHCMGWLQPII